MVSAGLDGAHIYAIPLLVALGFTCDSIRWRPSNLSSNPTQFVLGIYDDNDEYPGTLLSDTGALSVGSIAVRVDALSAPCALNSNTLYWLVIYPNVQVSVNSCFGLCFPSVIGISDNALANYKIPISYYVDYTWGSGLPASYPASADVRSGDVYIPYLEAGIQ
jgi:hypothetical protein